MKRARPLLGTFVEIEVDADSAAAPGAVSRAFDAISALEKILNVHDAASELSRVNRDAALHPVPVSRELRRVLCAALRLARLSNGAFDPAGGRYHDLELMPRARVRFKRTLRIDLGGIAKGYCVDRAVRELKRAGAKSGVVNAGGDLRAFGARAVALHLRDPRHPGRMSRFIDLHNAALATSASYATAAERCAGTPPIAPGLSISVQAPRAMIADGLTKVVARMGEAAAPLLARHGARAWIVGAPA